MLLQHGIRLGGGARILSVGKVLRKHRLEYFHAQEMPRHPFGLKAQKISDDYLLAGFVARLNRKDYNEAYCNGPWGGKAQPDSM